MMTDEADNKAKKPPKPRRAGQVIERVEGKKYLVRIFRGYKPDGQNDYFNKTIHGTSKDAEKWLRGALARRDRGEPLEDPDITFEALYDEWMLWAGTRPNEATGLQWKDVDWEKGSVELRRSIVRLHGNKWEWGDMKTDNSARAFTLPASFMAWLKEHRQAQLAQRLRIGRDWYDYDFEGQKGVIFRRSYTIHALPIGATPAKWIILSICVR